MRGTGFSLLVCSILLFLFLLSPKGQTAVVVFDNIPAPGQPGYDTSYYSHSFEAQNTSELGNVVGLAGEERVLNTVTVTMVTQAKAADWAALYAANPNGWYHEIMLTVWKADASEILATKTINSLIPWSQPASGYSGMAFNVGFDFSSENITLPDSILVSVAYSTQNDGYHPTGVAGPYNSLNYGTFDLAPIVGTDVKTGEVMRVFSSNTNNIVFETAPGWNNRTPMMKITATPASPASYAGQFGLTGPAADPGADPDGDGFSNVEEFVFGMNPAAGGSSNPIVVEPASEPDKVSAGFVLREGFTPQVVAFTDIGDPTNSVIPSYIVRPVSPQPFGLPAGYVKYEVILDTSVGERGFIRVDVDTTTP